MPRRLYCDTLRTLGGSPFVDTISNGSVSSGGLVVRDEPPFHNVFGVTVTESLEGEISALRSLFWSDRDPDGRGFAPLADAYRRAGDAKQALELLGDGMDRHPDFTPGHVVAARLYVEQGLFTEAEIAARRVLDLDPENVDALRSLVRALDEEGEVADFGTLAPDEPEAVAEDEVTDFGGLAPDEPEVVAEEEVADFAALAPDEPEVAPEEEEVADFAALAPDEPEVVAEDEVTDFGALTPDEPAEEIRTRTMADLYVTQGLIDRAIEVYEHLADADPDDAELRERLEQLYSGDQGTDGGSGETGAQPAESPAVEQVLEADEGDDTEVETLARDLAGSGDEEHDVDTPFAWAEEESEQPADVEEASSIRSFFDDLLSYEPASEPEES